MLLPVVSHRNCDIEQGTMQKMFEGLSAVRTWHMCNQRAFQNRQLSNARDLTSKGLTFVQTKPVINPARCLIVRSIERHKKKKKIEMPLLLNPEPTETFVVWRDMNISSHILNKVDAGIQSSLQTHLVNSMHINKHQTTIVKVRVGETCNKLGL
uniref:Uncharacterized protein n=1 Tax=Vespula pensylvanica TaxID=30213 RepID=A0A834UGM4_VESPE|nr:hypothetical protein H0235_001267 [Vespula pensylvanica]